MPEGFDTWESYFYPETFDPEAGFGTLRNKFGERDRGVLESREYGRVSMRAKYLQLGLAEVPQTFDAEHVRALHGYLFQDVYEWAGEYRTVELVKGRQGHFARVEDGREEVREALGRMAQSVRATDWTRAGPDEFSEGMAETFAWLNHAHPFREGNGRTAKEFLHQVAAQSPAHALDFDRVHPWAWNISSEASRPRRGEQQTHPEMMVEIFEQATIPRAQVDAKTARVLDLLRTVQASYPQQPGQQSEAAPSERRSGMEALARLLDRRRERDQEQGR